MSTGKPLRVLGVDKGKDEMVCEESHWRVFVPRGWVFVRDWSLGSNERRSLSVLSATPRPTAPSIFSFSVSFLFFPHRSPQPALFRAASLLSSPRSQFHTKNTDSTPRLVSLHTKQQHRSTSSAPLLPSSAYPYPRTALDSASRSRHNPR